ncbi:protein S100-P-like [Phyllostomus hastatus]|uniref:protein S100-P-like n=1 Tax=Phyllostomus hastatus TaxID=9423 RepID=UPI001E67E49A|nr:protein S100-P-like [Phyllostomus hastatus]
MSQLEMAMAMVIEVFPQFKSTDGNKQGLSKEELKERLEKELPGFLQSGRDKEAVDKLLKDLDASDDATGDLNEFIVFVAVIASTCYVYFEQKTPMDALHTQIPEGGHREQAPSFQKALGSTYVSGLES